jgi:hypothetical protein
VNLNDRFDTLDDNLKLDPGERDRAIASHNRLGDLLVAAGIAKRTRLQGSFARKTMLPPLHDIDKVIELVENLTATLGGPGGPEQSMLLIKERVEKAIPTARFEIKCHALGIILPDEGFDFDAVPGFNPENGTGWIRIADIEDDDWEPSNTYVLIDTIAARNMECEGVFIHQVRMAKQAVKNAGIDLPGLHTETFTYNAVAEKMCHAEAVAATLATGASMLLGAYTEPTGVDRIDLRLAADQKANAQVAMQQLATRASDALCLAAAGDEDGAAGIWHEIFGDAFPQPDGKAFLQSLHSGKGVTAAGTVASTVATPRTRAWHP